MSAQPTTTYSETYAGRRRELEEYFDRTAADAWAKLTSDAPVGRIRASVRAGRDRMRSTLVGYLPEDLRGVRVLDAGCGTGALAVELATRGAEVVAIDLAPTLIEHARERTPPIAGGGRIDFRVADMLDPSLGVFDWVIAMDSLIHYCLEDMVEMICRLSARARAGIAFTFAPRTPLLAFMHAVGQAFPRSNRSPDLQPVSANALRDALANNLEGLDFGRSERIESSFYISQTLELVRP